MAEAEVQFRDGIRPVKGTESRVFAVNEDPSLARKVANFDGEERALRIANEDINRKNKQVG